MIVLPLDFYDIYWKLRRSSQLIIGVRDYPSVY